MDNLSVEQKFKDIKSKLGNKPVTIDYRSITKTHLNRLDIMVGDS